VAYWQWADSYITLQLNTPSVDSIAQITDTVVGYPEISFFKKARLMPFLTDRPQLIE
jgi:hypothetical protein